MPLFDEASKDVHFSFQVSSLRFKKHLVRTARLALVLLFVFLDISTYGQTPDTIQLSLNQAVDNALDENRDIRISNLSLAKAQSQSKAVKGSFYPQISIDGRYTRNILRPVFFLPASANFPGAGDGGSSEGQGTVIEAGFDNSYQLTAQANLPLFNKELLSNADVASVSEDLGERGVAVSKNEVRTQVKKAYYDALLANENVGVLQQSLENAQLNLENVRNQYAKELVPQYDVIRAEVKVENVRPQILQAKNSYEAAVSNLKLLINLPENVPVELSQTLRDLYDTKKDKDIDKTFSVQQNPNLQQLKVQEHLREQQIDVQQASYYPSISAFGNYSFQAQANNFKVNDYRWVKTSAVGLSLNIPVFEGLTRSRKIEQAKLDLETAKLQRENLNRSLAIQAKNAARKLSRAEASIEAQRQNISQAQKGYEIARASYRSGVGTLIEVNDAELALTQARLNFVQVIYDYLTALAEFEQLTGHSQK